MEIVDRLRYGYVVDFLDLRIWVFNVVIIVVGVLVLVYLIVLIQSSYNKNRKIWDKHILTVAQEDEEGIRHF